MPSWWTRAVTPRRANLKNFSRRGGPKGEKEKKRKEKSRKRGKLIREKKRKKRKRQGV
jgi:hypothetical protein